MKPSPYNHFFQVKNGRVVLAYNSYSGALAEIEKENFPRVQELLARPSRAASTQDHEFLKCLKDGRFLIPDAVDQTATLKVQSRAGRLEGKVLTLTIAPSLACNFDCHYCFESHSNIRMSEETQEALLRFCDHHLIRSGALRVCWFGGEPTLCYSVIERVQSHLLEIAERRHTKIVPCTIISNGYLLDEPMARRLKDLQIIRAQITIDGPQAVHDSRRKLRNGKGSFDRIIENLSSTADILNINVRINVDKDNVDSAYEVMDILRQRKILDKVVVSFAQVRSSGTTCSDIRDRCYDHKEFARTLVQIHDRLLHQNINRIDYPRPLGGACCGALAEGYYVVSPTGHLFRCWEELSMDAKKSVGDLFSAQPQDYQRENLKAYHSWDPFALAGCKSCSILPVCMGGCPLSGMEKGKAASGTCSSWKYNLKDLLELAYSAAAQPATEK